MHQYNLVQKVAEKKIKDSEKSKTIEGQLDYQTYKNDILPLLKENKKQTEEMLKLIKEQLTRLQVE